MATFKNTYDGGIDKDTSKAKFQPNRYFELNDFRVATEGGLSSFALETERGNKFQFEFPSIGGIQKVTIVSDGSNILAGTLNPPVQLHYSILINGEPSTFYGDETSNQEAIYNSIIGKPGVALSILNGEYSVYNKEDGIYFYTLTSAPTLAIQSILTAQQQFIIDSSGLSINPPFTSEEYIPDIPKVKVIGWGNLRNNLILFTTGGVGDGQIWKVSYDEELEVIKDLQDGFLTIKDHLLYYEKLNFSISSPIQNEVIGRYENSRTQRVYWTDNLNAVRALNIVGKNLMGLLPRDLEINSYTLWDQPEILEIRSGEIPTGSVVSFAYRMKSTALGKLSQMSPVSNQLQLTEFNPQETPHWKYKGSPNNANNKGRGVRYRVKKVPGEYDIMQHIAIYYVNNDVPNIVVFKESLNNTQEIIYVGNEDPVAILESADVTTINIGFTTAKTLSYKDKRLIAGNLKDTDYKKIELFDTRSYRFDANESLLLEGNLGGTYQHPFFPDPLWFDLIDKEADCICPYNSEDEQTRVNLGTPENVAQYKYNINGELGGSGKNISYRFVTEDMILDSKNIGDVWPTLVEDPVLGTGTERFPIANVNETFRFYRTESNGITGRAHLLAHTLPSHKDPVFTSLYTGYTRDEVYRFGIVFYLRSGGISPVSWIGDIRFPPILSIPFCFTATSSIGPVTWGKTLGIEFSVNIEEIRDNIIGYRIVRVERKEKDKRVLGGALRTKISKVNGIFQCPATPFAAGEDSGYIRQKNKFALISPLTMLEGTSYDFSGSVLLQEEFNFLTINQAKYINPDVDGQRLNVYTLKTPYIPSWIDYEPKEIKHQKLIYKNTETTLDGDTYSTQTAVTKRHIVKTLDWPIFDTFRPSYVNYIKKDVVQYDGDTYFNRSISIYIPCSDYVPTFKSNSNINLKVFGGDTYINYFDYELQSSVEYALATSKVSVGIAFPVESSFNVGLRQHETFNDRRTAVVFQDQFTNSVVIYNPVYNQSSSITSLESLPINIELATEFPHRIVVSEEKLDGELEDAWRVFLPNNVIDVEGVYGEVNKLITHADQLVFYQDRAFGTIPINEKLILASPDSSPIRLGTGDVVSNFKYISTKTGVQHRNAIVSTTEFLYHLDSRLKKIYKFGSSAPLSDVKGLTEFFSKNIDGKLILNESIDISGVPNSNYNIQSVYDQKNNRVLWTVTSGVKSFTISFNELLDSFEGFYSYKPLLYLKDDSRIFSLDPTSGNKVYIQDTGDYGVYFDKPPVESNITLIINGQNDFSKEWNNLEWNSECIGPDGLDISETFSRLSINTEVQDTGDISPINPLRRTWRTWRTVVPRDLTEGKSARIRNPWIFLELGYQNNENKRFICHDLISHVQDTSFMPYTNNKPKET